MYGILGGVKMILRLRVPGDSTHPIHYYTIHQLAYYIHTTRIITNVQAGIHLSRTIHSLSIGE